ncbi:hypothetical protein [Bradyrhizobium sp. sGM-13]|uniref:hypothetical protein n=1 Tax=Bradyrhizobium sp. sGM-13 TaxID=2831781 RepID=UPI001BD110F6|nr:hypothetical protein [Bradyrhizobium sp. sGM-13]
MDQAVSQLGSKEKESIAVKETSRDASIGDLFSGERGTDFQTVDVPRVQQLAFTAILAGTYALTALKLFRGAAPGSAIASLPEIGEGFIALLSISSTVYMGGKALPGLAQQMTGASEKTEDQASPTVAKASSSGGAVG